MIKVCRLSISYKDEKQGMKDVLNNALVSSGVTMENISVSGPEYGHNTHFGNWVLTPVQDNESTNKLSKQLGTKTDNHRGFLEKEDIKSFNIGDKVKIGFTSDLGFSVSGEGKVYRKTDNEITIIKKRSRSKGWTFRVWDEVLIEKI